MGDRYRDLIDAFLECVAGDPDFRRRLRQDPQGTLESSGFARRVQEILPDAWSPDEVVGYGCQDTCFNQWTCLSNSCVITI